ncbi:MAG TPA: T9SS type A sorting domain-containing protein, partial [Bacteroidia bacterium]|nr:T9SS type A sorting domain-containing protein [Bacteroidia bacterium]
NSLSVSSPSLELSGNQQIQMFFGTNDQVYDGGLLTICKTYTNTTDWVDIGQSACSIGAAQQSTAQVGSITSSLSGPTSFNSFSYFTLGRLNGTGKNPLPIKLLDFTAVPNGEKVDLAWETATEIDNAYFTVEKSKDGNSNSFTKVIDVPGAGNSNVARDYAEVDYQPYSGVSYYRLKQTDKNGNYTYSNIVPVNFDVNQNMVICPNPVTANTTGVGLKVTGYSGGQQVIVVLRDVQGREFLTTVLVTVDNNNIPIKIEGTETLLPGTYIVTASSNNKIYNSKLVVK